MKKIFVIAIIAGAIIACGGADKKNTDKPSPNKKVAKALDGKKIFKQNCVICHGADGKLGINGSKDLTLSEMDLEERIAIITNGKGTMTPFNALLSEDKIKAVAEYTFTLK